MNDSIENALNANKNDLGILIDKFDELIAATLQTHAKPKIPFDRALWGIDDIAEYLRLSYKYVQEYIISHHTFPDAIRLKFNNAKKGHPRWYAREVVEWAAKYREG